jgi:aryl carrier-like protein
MSHSDWQIPISAKVQGAWNLHRALQKEQLDFFVLLSSVYGVRGNHGQASYAAASSFLDAFVQYRQQQNLPASVIDLGPLDDIGHVAERPKLLDELRRIGAPFLKETDFLESLELAIQSSHLPTCGAPSIASSFINRAQFVVGGIPHPLDARGQGLARIFEGSKNDFAAEEETSLSLEESNKMQRFMQDVKRNPKSLDDDPAVIEAFLAAQIFEAVKSLLIFDDDDVTELNDSSTMSGFNIDSLMAIELQNWWRQSMGTQVGILELTQGTSAWELGKMARSRLLEALSC